MIGADAILEQARADGIRPEEVEKEYLQYAFLHSLADNVDGLEFRGGTMLRVAHLHPRYSEDLDFVRHHSPEEAEASVEAALADVVHWGLRAKHKPADITANAMIWRVEFRGPLYSKTKTANRVKIEVAAAGKTGLASQISIMAQKYADIPAFTLPTQDLRETAAEKVRALVERDFPRDLYDIAFLIDQGHLPGPELVEAKLKWNPAEAPRQIQPHGPQNYDRDLRDWVPARARLPWKDAWQKALPLLARLRCVRLPTGIPQ